MLRLGAEEIEKSAAATPEIDGTCVSVRVALPPFVMVNVRVTDPAGTATLPKSV